MKEHISRHWKTLAVFFVLILIATNLNSILFFLTRNLNFLPNSKAQETQTTVSFDFPAGKYVVGDSITVQVLLSSPTQTVNASSGEITFSKDLLKLEGISIDDSINTLWIPDAPYFSTTSGSIIFSGGMPNPGFEAVGGNILTLTFQALGPGDAQLGINNLIILANDGAATRLNASAQPIDIVIQTLPVNASSASSFAVGDINRDNRVDLSDLSILIANWGIPKDPNSDLDGNGKVDDRDLSILLSRIDLPTSRSFSKI